MDAFSNFKIKSNNIEELLEKLEDCCIDYTKSSDNNTEIIIEDCYEVVWLDELKDLFLDMAKENPYINFTVSGTIDSSASAGEFMDFTFEYNENKLTTKFSCWYLMNETELYDNDYQTFLEETEKEDTPENKKFFESATKTGVFYILDSGDGDLTLKVPLSETEEDIV